LASFLIKVGMEPENIIDIFRKSSDFNEKLTRYQVNHISGSQGSQSEYLPPNCDSLRTHSVCRNPDNTCRKIKHPLTYYMFKSRLLNKTKNKND